MEWPQVRVVQGEFTQPGQWADAVAGHACEFRFVDEIRRWIPQVEMVVHVQHLQRGGGNQLALAAEDARGLRAADCLAAREGHEVCAGGGN